MLTLGEAKQHLLKWTVDGFIARGLAHPARTVACVPE